ncbi:MAG: class I SAM-dependent methyltransferase [Candidatus Competibacter denitrificans]
MMRVTATRPSGRSIATAAVLAVGLLFGLSATAMAQGPGPQRTAPPEMANLPPPEQATPPGGVVAQPMATLTVQVPVTSNMSLVHVGSSDSFAITPEGRQAATDLFEALGAAERQETAKMTEKAKSALAIYAKIIPRENYGGEYTALQWFADYLLADNAKKAEMTTEPLTNEFFKMFGGNNYQVLKEYLQRKYRLKDTGDEETYTGQMRKAYLEDTILFNNPRRESWEHTTELVSLLDLKPGAIVADVGSGPGYYSFRFAKLVGPTGRVIAIDTVAEHLKYVEQVKTNLGVTNIETLQTDGKTLGLKGRKVNAVFLCSLYHNIYAMSTAPERDSFVNAIREALTDDGLLYLADNGLVQPGILPYHGPYIAKELLIAQLLNYGFDLVRQHQHIPQRYLLVFKKRPDNQAPAPIPPGAGFGPAPGAASPAVRP